jgi:hypothetical protein
MLDFVWHLRGSIALDAGSADEIALARLERLLERQRKSVSQRGARCLSFDDPIWRNPFQPGGLAMGIYDRGWFWIEPGLEGRKLRYDLRSLHGMIFCSVAAFTAFVLGLAGGGVLLGFKVGAAAFAWLYGMSVLLALFRVPAAIRKAVANV